MMPLTASDLAEIREVIRDNWTALVIRVYGAEITGADQAEIDRLVRAGILDPAAAAAIDPIRDSYVLGLLRRRLETAGVEVLTLARPALLELLRTNPVPLTVAEEGAVAAARMYAGQYAMGLGNRIENQALSAVNVEDMGLRARMETVIRDETTRAVEERLTARQLASNLGNATQDWARDWRRIAATEMQRAQEHGRAADIRQRYGGDATVCKVPSPHACVSCRRLYLDDNVIPEEKRPRIFRLDDLLANGTNVGRKQRDWLPVIDPTHPNCVCALTYLPRGWHFDHNWEIVPMDGADA